MDLPARVKLKNSQLSVREAKLQVLLKNDLIVESRRSSLMILVVMPLCIGFVAQRLSGLSIAAQFIRALFPLGILFQKV